MRRSEGVSRCSCHFKEHSLVLHLIMGNKTWSVFDVSADVEGRDGPATAKSNKKKTGFYRIRMALNNYDDAYSVSSSSLPWHSGWNETLLYQKQNTQVVSEGPHHSGWASWMLWCVFLIIWVIHFVFLWLLKADFRGVYVCVCIVLWSIVWACVGVCMEGLLRVLMRCVWSVWVSLWFWDDFVLFDILHGNCLHVDEKQERRETMNVRNKLKCRGHSY